MSIVSIMVPPRFRHLPQNQITLFAKERKEGAIFCYLGIGRGDAARSCCYFNFAISTSP